LRFIVFKIRCGSMIMAAAAGIPMRKAATKLVNTYPAQYQIL
jgi:hypothetical protein